jgi:hypothetical protein
LIFKPEIHGITIKNPNIPAEKIVKCSESYNYYLQKTKKVREDKIKNEKELEKIPGSGKIWTSSITIPKKICLSTSKVTESRKYIQRSNTVDLNKSFSASLIRTKNLLNKLPQINVKNILNLSDIAVVVNIVNYKKMFT